MWTPIDYLCPVIESQTIWTPCFKLNCERKYKSFIKGNQFENVSKMTATLSLPESVETSRLSIWMGALPKLFLSRCSLDTIWCDLNQFENIVCKITVTLPRPKCVNILWTILSGLHLTEYAIPNQFPNLGAMWIKYCFHTIVWRMAAIFLGLNVLTNCCWSKIASILQTIS